jgi:uncharacterized membrane protein
VPSLDALPAGPQPRWGLLDLARGVAVAAMVVYHTAWDLSFLHLIGTDVVASPGWSLLARATAASFLALAGVGLVLAHRSGIRWRAFLRRLGTITGAALAITLITRIVFPETYIAFGILHCIAASSVLALAFLRAPLSLVVLATGLSLAAPSLLASPAFDAPVLRWTGLGAVPPATNDWVPVLPWFGWVLVGIAAARFGTSLVRPGAVGWAPTGVVAQTLISMGRHSLPIYLLHQPLIFGLLLLAAQLAEPEETADRGPFLKACEQSCRDTGRDDDACARACLCVAEGGRRDGLWSPMVRGRLSDSERERVLVLTRACFGAANGRESGIAPG